MSPSAFDFIPPAGYGRIKLVRSFEELVETPFRDGVNALCWRRELTGDFGEIAGLLTNGPGIVPVEASTLESLSLSSAGEAAARFLLEDLRQLRELDLAPELNCILAYPRDDDSGPVRTDVYSFHADSAPVEAATWLCTYHGRPSEGLRNDEARRQVDIPETRAKLLNKFGGADDDDFREHLQEHAYDLHYAPLPGAVPFRFGLGNLWRIAIEYPGCPVPPCIHRAPETLPGDPPRLLLIS